jgi:hypothetical protein
MNGIAVPGMIIPPLHLLRANVAPAGGVCWTDEKGWHCKSVTPFPGASLLGSEQALVMGGVGLGASIVLPALNAAKERANRVYSASNLRQIGQGCLLYANEHRGAYPPDLGTLITSFDMNVETFVDPSGSTIVPSQVRNGTPQQQAAWANQNSDFVYLGTRINAGKPADRVLAHSKLEIRPNDGMNIMFNDGRVMWFNREEALRVLQEDDAKARAEGRAR